MTIVSIAVALAGCDVVDEGDHTPGTPGAASRPNPAAVRCTEDGYQVEVVLTHGAPTGSNCVEPQSGQKCETWAYFHGECELPPAGGRER